MLRYATVRGSLIALNTNRVGDIAFCIVLGIAALPTEIPKDPVMFALLLLFAAVKSVLPVAWL